MSKQIDFQKHWTEMKFSNELLPDALIKHTLNLMLYGMSDLGEVFEVVENLEDGNDNSWNSAWSNLAFKLQKRAEEFEIANKPVSAASAYLRASTYWRVSLMYFGGFSDPRMKDYTEESIICYARYLELSNYPGEYIEIPYENTYLPGHFYRSPYAKEKAPVLVIVPGRDTWAEDTRWVYDGAINRGIHALVFEGPGQGSSLRLNNLSFRPDWENVVSPVLDYTERIHGIDSSRIGVMGLSFGGFLAPRAAAFDKRIKICIADPGNINWGGEISKRLDKVIGLPKDQRPSALNFLLEDYEWKHGVPEERIVAELEKYNNTDIIKNIKAKTLVLDGSAEMTQGARVFYDKLTCPKDYLLFDENSTAQSHTQMGGYATATEYIFNWLEDNL
ncbi:alpha/beta fold hydrolase [Enterococcus avium]|uniref:alpha/beta hydrolase family protein n=1 Tax=Enterococcus avium TaxID=33945 RepID=UPI0025B1C633|nr:alpha/beta fold hydrolase [Enterococcus avium]MDN2638030.1 alpha/beta fold hydrolase [Enterococcus avium]